jgi:hypothetical protein
MCAGRLRPGGLVDADAQHCVADMADRTKVAEPVNIRRLGIDRRPVG